jgi:uncharacterized protein (DUF1501 family)
MIRDGLLAVSAGMILPPIFARAVRAAKFAAAEGSTWAQQAQNNVLIVVQMAGGNDGLNTVIPYTDGHYYSNRPTLGIQHSGLAFTFDDRRGAHPGLKALQPLWQAGKLAIVEGVGYPNPNLSHFASMDIWQTLDLNGVGGGGWLGKYVADYVDKDGHPLPFSALSVGATLPTALQSLNASVATIASAESYRVHPDAGQHGRGSSGEGLDARMQALLKLYNTYPQSAPYAALLNLTAQNAVSGSQALQQSVAQYQPKAQYDTSSSFQRGLQLLAEAIVQGLGLRVGYVTLGGFDTHADQANTQAALLKDLSDGLHAFYSDLEAQGVADNVVVMTWSEFGRRVEENASLGTDHGTAAPLFVLGNKVQGGAIYGESPDLTRLDSYGNLIYTTDFRSIYATILDRWLGAPSSLVLGGTYGGQGFLPGS